MNQTSHPNALPTGYEIHWYRIEEVLGQGAFGITYLAHDINLERKVAIKEYMPGQASIRNSDHSIQAVSSEHQDDFEWGLKRFISEARTLTRFEHPNLVRVFNVFEMNNTAYMVMNYEIGKGLQDILKSRKTLREDELIKILIPLMGGLEVMHEKGFIHRDIKPGNIFIRLDGSPVLIDFGSARQTRNPRGNEGEIEPQTLTNFVSPGYAPIEQYAGKSDRQGPWTDIYGLGATLYRAMTGEMPIASIDRSETIVHDGKDAYLPVSRIAADRYSERFVAAVDHALEFKTMDRPQSITEWQDEFGITQDDIETVPVPEVQTQASDDVVTERIDTVQETTIDLTKDTIERTEKIEPEVKTFASSPEKAPVTKSPGRQVYYITGAAALLVICGVIFTLVNNGDDTNIVEQQATPVSVQQQATQPEEAVGLESQTQQSISSPEPITTADQQKIRELLMQAEEDIKALRLTSPKENNAYEKYQQVLKLDQENTDARNGIQSISDRYVAMAYTAMKNSKTEEAARYLAKAEKLAPGAEKITAAREKLQATVSAAPAVEGISTTSGTATAESAQTETQGDDLLGSVKEWYKKQAEQNRDVKKEDTTSDRFIRSLGGGN